MQRNTELFSCSVELYAQMRYLSFTQCQLQFVGLGWSSGSQAIKYPTHQKCFVFVCFALFFNDRSVIIWCGACCETTGIILGIKDANHLAMIIKKTMFNPKHQKATLSLITEKHCVSSSMSAPGWLPQPIPSAHSLGQKSRTPMLGTVSANLG